MAPYRYIHTSIFEDPWVSSLDPEGFKLWVFLFANEKASATGLYNLVVKRIAYNTDIPKEKCQELLDQFQADGKILYDGEVIWVKNMLKYQFLGQHDKEKAFLPSVQIGIYKDLNEAKKGPVKEAYLAAQGYHPDTVFPSTVKELEAYTAMVASQKARPLPRLSQGLDKPCAALDQALLATETETETETENFNEEEFKKNTETKTGRESRGKPIPEPRTPEQHEQYLKLCANGKTHEEADKIARGKA